MTLTERVAIALYEHDIPNAVPWDRARSRTARKYMDRASAAVAVLSEDRWRHALSDELGQRV